MRKFTVAAFSSGYTTVAKHFYDGIATPKTSGIVTVCYLCSQMLLRILFLQNSLNNYSSIKKCTCKVRNPRAVMTTK